MADDQNPRTTATASNRLAASAATDAGCARRAAAGRRGRRPIGMTQLALDRPRGHRRDRPAAVGAVRSSSRWSSAILVGLRARAVRVPSLARAACRRRSARASSCWCSSALLGLGVYSLSGQALQIVAAGPEAAQRIRDACSAGSDGDSALGEVQKAATELQQDGGSRRRTADARHRAVKPARRARRSGRRAGVRRDELPLCGRHEPARRRRAVRGPPVPRLLLSRHRRSLQAEDRQDRRAGAAGRRS